MTFDPLVNNGSFYGFLTLLVTMLYQGWTAARQRRWDKEDAEKLAEKTAKTLAEKTEAEAKSLRELVQNSTRELQLNSDKSHALTAIRSDSAQQQIVSKVADLSKIAQAAFTEANNLNGKIAELHRRGNDGAAADAERLAVIDSTTTDTNQRVKALETVPNRR